MNENTDIIDVSIDNISAADGGVTTTPEEVAQLLNIKTVGKVEAVVDDEEEEEETNDTEDVADTADAPVVADKVDAPVENKTEDVVDVPKFEFEIEDASGDKFILKPGDNLEEVLKDFEPKNNGQIFAIIDKLNDLKVQKNQYDQEQATKSAQAETDAKIAAIHSGWDAEIKELQGSKRLEITTDGKPSARVDEVFKYMNEENARRMENGKPIIQSFEDALDKIELKESKEAAIEKAKEAKELNKKRGGMVGGSSASAVSASPSYKGGARNANEALRQFGLIKQQHSTLYML